MIKVSKIVEKKFVEKVEKGTFGLITEVPAYPFCKNLPSKEEKKHCMSLKTDVIIHNEFINALGAELSLYSIYRIYRCSMKKKPIRIREPEKSCKKMLKVLLIDTEYDSGQIKKSCG
ncbi:hypothetical protein ML462_13710 [Gramella lutea]|uniref:Uncharacterized protein n=1 Tax=Christiangramia lutea TaxID=1607951 RepID=A0A9X2AA20_9FLAO|nr:hypothetical protein [Christiangramia lutea]MCH4824229.1 hypothetical protein [Christiangramia lutea]